MHFLYLETLRLFPPGAFSTKLCTESIEFENRNGKTLKINEGTTVVLPIHALMADEEHYENASSFEPERFLDGGLKKYRDQGLYLAFGDGPRICLGELGAYFSSQRKLQITYFQVCVSL